MTKINDRELFTKGPQFIKPDGMVFPAPNVIKSDATTGKVTIESPRATAPAGTRAPCG